MSRDDNAANSFGEHEAIPLSVEEQINEILDTQVTTWESWANIPFESLSQIIQAHNSGGIRSFGEFVDWIDDQLRLQSDGNGIVSDISYDIDEQGYIICNTIRGTNPLATETARTMQWYCSQLQDYGVVLDTTEASQGILSTLWTSETITEVYEGVAQVAARLHGLVQEYCQQADCGDLADKDQFELFAQLFTFTPEEAASIENVYGQGSLRFLLERFASNEVHISRYGIRDAAMGVDQPDNIVVFASGYGFSGSGDRLIPRYNVSHELFHILTRVMNLRASGSV